MSFEFIYNTMPKSEFVSSKPVVICNNKFHAKKKSDKIFLDQNDAEEMLACEVKNEQCGYAFYYDAEGITVSSSAVKLTESKLNKLVARYIKKGQELVIKASAVSTRSCSSCGKRVDIEKSVAAASRHFNGLLPQLKNTSVVGAKISCPHCGQGSLPFTSTQQASLDELMERVINAKKAYKEAYANELALLAKKGRVGVCVAVAAWVHESYLDEDDDEY